MAKKEKPRTDIIAQAEKATGIHYQEIIHAALKNTVRSLNEIDEVVYYYERGKTVPKRVYDFARFLLEEWEKKEARKLWKIY